MSKMGKMCLNWKVLGGLAAVAVGVWLMAPNLLVSALPLLLFALCPLSMLLMMRAMQGEHSGSEQRGGQEAPRAVLQEERGLPDLKADLTRAEAERTRLREEIARREAGSVSAGGWR